MHFTGTFNPDFRSCLSVDDSASSYAYGCLPYRIDGRALDGPPASDGYRHGDFHQYCDFDTNRHQYGNVNNACANGYCDSDLCAVKR